MIPYIGADVLPRSAPEARAPATRQPGDVHHPLDREVLLARAAVARGRDLGAVHALPPLPRVGIPGRRGHPRLGRCRRRLLDAAGVPAPPMDLPLRAGSALAGAGRRLVPHPRHPPRLPLGPRPAGHASHGHLRVRGGRVVRVPLDGHRRVRLVRRHRRGLHLVRPDALLPPPRRANQRRRQVAAKVPSRASLPDTGSPLRDHHAHLGLRIRHLSARSVPGLARRRSAHRGGGLNRLWAVLACGACAPVMHQARLAPEEPPSAREVESAERVAACPAGPGLFVPGVLQSCRGRTGEGKLLTAMALAELGVGIGSTVANGPGSNATGVPFFALADLFTLSVMDLSLENQRALRLSYVPQESVGELARAPFSGEVLSRPAVWAGIAGSLAAGILVSALVDGGVHTENAGRRPVIFGREVNSAAGYPLAGAIGIGLFEHV